MEYDIEHEPKYLMSKANTQNRNVPALKQQSKTYSCKI
jgi:ribosomal protein L39E